MKEYKLNPVLGLLLLLSFSSFEISQNHDYLQDRKLYATKLNNGDTLTITNSIQTCFGNDDFTFVIIQNHNELEVTYTNQTTKDTLIKTLPLSFKLDLIEYESRTAPYMSYGAGSSCMMIFTFNDQLPDTVHQCPEEQYLSNLIEKIKTSL